MKTESIINRDESYYSQIEKFSMRRKTVYNLIKTYVTLTTHEIKDKMLLEKHQVSGRVTELLELCFIKSIGSKLNEKTGKQNTVWVITSPEEREKLVAKKLYNSQLEKDILEHNLVSYTLHGYTVDLIEERIKKLNKLINTLN